MERLSLIRLHTEPPVSAPNRDPHPEPAVPPVPPDTPYPGKPVDDPPPDRPADPPPPIIAARLA